MMKRLLAVWVLVLGIISPSEAAQITLGVVRFSSPPELLQEADTVTETFRQNLGASDAISVVSRTKTDYSLDGESDISEVSSFGRAEGCSYMLIGSVNQDKDIVVSVRAVDVQTAKVMFSMSAVSPSSGLSALSVVSSALGSRIRERFTGEYPKVLSVHSKEIRVNRGSSSGVREGDLFRVYGELNETLDKDGTVTGRDTVDLAIIEVKSVQKDSGTAGLLKDAGSTQILSRLRGCRIEPISREEAKRLIKRRAFSLSTIDKKISDSQRNQLSLSINPSLSAKSENSLNNLRASAEAGYPISQFRLGKYYLHRKDFPLALKWLASAADMGNTGAMNDLGYMHEYGMGVQQDYQKAFDFYLKAAEKGNASAQNNLGGMYLNAKGVKQDFKKAILWFGRASQQGNAAASNNLARMYQEGLGTKQDIGKAIDLFRQAAEQGDMIAKINLGTLYANMLPKAKKASDKKNYLENARAWFQDALSQAKREGNNEIARIVQERLNTIAKLSYR
ncbi:MAG: sel1 repeat family protein [Synergistaceae bacterium]|nr:sel1 repeat family protein [Synergistaceae bacterium]